MTKTYNERLCKCPKCLKYMERWHIEKHGECSVCKNLSRRDLKDAIDYPVS